MFKVFNIVIWVMILGYSFLIGIPRLISTKSDWTVGFSVFIILLCILCPIYWAINKLNKKENEQNEKN